MTKRDEVPARRLRAGSELYRAHGLGNDYLVFEVAPSVLPGWTVTPDAVRAVCDRHVGVGSDGIVLLVDREPADGVFPLRMFNPDGSEFERSGNGLRVLASYLHGEGLVGDAPFRVRSGGSEIPMTVHSSHATTGEYDISVQMGRARVGSGAVSLDPTQLDPEGRAVHPTLGPIAFVPVSVGNPHAVVFEDEAGRGVDLRRLDLIGSFLATHPAFRGGTNVQLVWEVEEGRIRIGIWERGVGRTTASGTSSCAAAAAAVATGRLKEGAIVVEMEGGPLDLRVSPDLEITLRGPVQAVERGRLVPGFVEGLG